MDEAQRLIEQGRTARNAGDREGALKGYKAAAAMLRQMDAPLRLAHTVRHVGDIQREAGNLLAARLSYADALGIYRAHSGTEKLDLANTLRGYGLLMETLGDGTMARAMWVEAVELYGALGLQVGVDEAQRRAERLTLA